MPRKDNVDESLLALQFWWPSLPSPSATAEVSSDKQPPTRAKARIDNADPHVTKSNTLIELPSRAAPYRLMDEPNRAKERQLRMLPIEK
jgi:hypothetical protein